MLVKLLDQLRKAGKAAKSTRTGRVAVRTGRGLTTHTADKFAVRGVQRLLGRRYEDLSKADKWVVDQITELATQFVINLTEDEVIHISSEEAEDYSETQSEAIMKAFANAVMSKSISLGYDEIFGEIDRNGRVLVGKDLIKESLLAAISEIVDGSQQIHG